MNKLFVIAVLAVLGVAGPAEAGKFSGRVDTLPTSLRGTSSQVPGPWGFDFSYCAPSSRHHVHGHPDPLKGLRAPQPACMSQ